MDSISNLEICNVDVRQIVHHTYTCGRDLPTISLAAPTMLTIKRSADLAPELDLRECTLHSPLQWE